jgi:hypothetical protein
MANRETINETGRLDLKEEMISADSAVYIDIFGRLFEYFEEVYSFISIGLIRQRDVRLLEYWADMVVLLKHDNKYIFVEYLLYYEFFSVFILSGVIRSDVEIRNEILRLQPALIKRLPRTRRRALNRLVGHYMRQC